jgi:hypothetical protein
MAPHDRFLNSRSRIEPYAPLGRVFSVVRETWRLDCDPRSTPPRTELLVSQRSASDAADLARQAASGLPERGFHKPSGAWWGSDGESFHRFVVSGPRRRRPALIALALGAGAIATLIFRQTAQRNPVRVSASKKVP